MAPRDRRHPTFRFPRRSRERIRDDVREELEFHVAARAEALVRQGMDPARARAEAEQEFGDLGATAVYCAGQDRATERARRRAAWYHELTGDLKVALRSFRRRPFHAAVAAATLTLGLASALAMTTVMKRLVIAPYPFPGGDRLVMLWQQPPGGGDVMLLPFSDVVEAWRTRATSLEALESIRPHGRVLLDDGGDPVPVSTSEGDEQLFPFLHLTPELGRWFIADDRRPGAPGVVVISHDLWRRRFGGAPDVTGRHIRLGDAEYDIVGVAPASLRGIPGLSVRVDVWLPAPATATARAARFAMARLRPGVTPAEAERELTAISRSFSTGKATPGSADVRTPQDMLGRQRLLALRILWAASALLLLVAAVNYTHLLLARTAERSRELAVRSALGASRWRIVRLGLVEGLVLGAIAFVAHVPLSLLLLRAAALSRPDTLWMLDGIALDHGVLLASLAGTILLTACCAIVATWSALPRTFTPLRSASAVSVPPAHRLRRTLIAAEVALACVLVVGATLLARSFVELVRRDPGFQPDGALIVSLTRPGTAAPASAGGEDPRWDALQRTLEAQPDIRGVARGLAMPPESGIEFGHFDIEGRAVPSGAVEQTFSSSYVSAGFFRIAGIRILDGTDFPPEARLAGEPVIINRSMARRFWPGGGAVGQRIRFTVRGSPGADAGKWHRIVGVVDDVLDSGLHTDVGSLHIYHSLREFGGTPEFFVRYRGTLATAMRQVRSLVHAVVPGVAVNRMETVDSLLLESARADRFYLIVLGVIALLAGMLAIAGVFGVVASITLQRTREIAVRMALGSTPSGVYAIVVGDGMRAVLVGLAGGIAGALALGRVLRSLLYGVSAVDPLAFVAATACIAIAATGACLLPARRAAHLQPASVLRSD